MTKHKYDQVHACGIKVLIALANRESPQSYKKKIMLNSTLHEIYHA